MVKIVTRFASLSNVIEDVHVGEKSVYDRMAQNQFVLHIHFIYLFIYA